MKITVSTDFSQWYLKTFEVDPYSVFEYDFWISIVSFMKNHHSYDFILLKNIFLSFLELWKNLQKYILKINHLFSLAFSVIALAFAKNLAIGKETIIKYLTMHPKI